MDISNTKELKDFALRRLENSQQSRRIVLIYSGLILGLAAAVSLMNYLLGQQISQTGGLSNLGTRSILSAVQALLPVAQMVLVLCVDLGYVSAMLRVARGQAVTANSLRLGFDRFWPLLRLTLIRSLIFVGIGFGCVYLATFIFMMTPLSDAAVEILMPMVSQSSMLEGGLLLDDATYFRLMGAMAPVMAIFGLLYAAVAIPVAYRYRLADFLLIDYPGQGAMYALRQSRYLMRGKRVRLLRLDVSLWWYYLAVAAAMAVCYGDQLLPLVGIQFPWSVEVGYFLFYALYLGAQFAVYYFLRNRVEVTYALFYDAVSPRKREDNGVVLGNIFQM